MDLNFTTMQIFLLIILAIIFIIIVVVVSNWKKVNDSNTSIKLLEKEIELKKMAMVEKDLDSKRLIENQLPLPKEQQERLSELRKSTSDIMGDVGYLHSEINERLSLLEAKTEHQKLLKMLNELEKKEKQLLKNKK
ncbi:hypothetical protein [Methanobrevibacter filiformis]|uniref:Uncharacterized protein n=1 Tax=Methanobrevibacter filiformis TaxID=55758 RepID=A0A166CFS3_9EURY|nr:hypothetical protein [Methanobrevibacter filiformis]KZX14460.1 hypothetical protein MBFIL_08570 [Methanobrevibacter filiformis]